ncbi:hypothetical protein [Sulfurimonas hydrogeniphila]|uniref:hypothetical protein n=1 Tax=Sulfurimonas TaxID=202746 RepID=UPI00125FD25A|nr:hypothetical protein [Sulfurimonas hydrogeniphila]
MAIFDFDTINNNLEKIDRTSFQVENILERTNLQDALKKQIDIIAPDCLVISEEFSEWDGSKRRIDLLAIDKEANLVVIELKRDETGEHMELQAIRYASMVSTLTFSRTVKIYQKYLDKSNISEDAENNLLKFLEWDENQADDFALDVKIILVSSNFSKEITTSVMWLNERNIDIKCIRLVPYKLNEKVLIDVQQIIPLPEAENYQIQIKQQVSQRREARQTDKDYTNYKFQGEIYNKRKLVLAVMKKYFEDNTPNDIEDFRKNFSNQRLFAPLQDAIEKANKHGQPRHFLKDGEPVTIGNEEYAISNQWGVGNIEDFVNDMRKLGYQIDES